MSSALLFESWRTIKRADHSWGLSWFLASEVCKRFYSSHGIVPWAIDHSGMGFYGIKLEELPCPISGASAKTFGRFTIQGDAENWQTGSPGDHGCDLIEQCCKGVPTETLIANAVAHFRIPEYPSKSHASCRHKRWGSSYELCFEIATLIALRFEPETIGIWNHPDHTSRVIKERDPNHKLKQHPGAFLFTAGKTTLCLAGDGRVLDGSEVNLWSEYMRGKTTYELSKIIVNLLNA